MKNLNIGAICTKEKEFEAYNIIHSSYDSKSLEKLYDIPDAGNDTNQANIGYFDDAHYTFMRLKIDKNNNYYSYIGSHYDQILLIGSKEEIESFTDILTSRIKSSLFERIITNYVPEQYQILTIEI